METETTQGVNIDDTIERVRSSAHEVIDKAAQVSAEAAVTMSEKSEQFKNAEQQFLADCREYMDKNPIASLGIAAAAGFIFSRLLSGR